MKPFIWLDAKILGAVERLSHAIQRTFGIGCQRSAILCYGAFIVLMANRNILQPLLQGKHPDWLVVAFTPIYLLVYLWVMPKQADTMERINAKGFSNHKKNDTYSIVFRSVMLFMTIFCLLPPDVSAGFSMLAFMFSVYLEACDDLPPGQSRVRRWLNNIAAFGRKPVEVPTNA